MKLKLKEVRSVIREAVQNRALVEAKATADKIISEKDSFLGNLARKVGFSDPSKDVDDPKHVTKTLDKTMDKASRSAEEFQASSLRTTKEINAFHDSIKDMMDKVSSLSDTLGPEKAKQYHERMIALARDFYKLLKSESDRIDSYLKTIGSDLEDKGMKKNAAYKNTSGLNKKSGFVPKRPSDMPDFDDDVLSRSGVKKQPYLDDQTSVLNYDDPDQVDDFLKGKSKVKARG